MDEFTLPEKLDEALDRAYVKEIFDAEVRRLTGEAPKRHGQWEPGGDDPDPDR